MNSATILLLTLTLSAGDPPTGQGRITGVVRNASHDHAPVAGADVVLRVQEGGAPVLLDATTSDAQGRFVFENLPVVPGLVYLPGANRDGVHYPGPRVRLSPFETAVDVPLDVYDVAAEPSPLIARRYELSARVEQGLLEVTERLVIANPSLHTYVGKPAADAPAVTLTLSLPDGFETVTFDKEFHGRQFRIEEGRLVTDMPWPPGERELGFSYRLPIEKRRRVLNRPLDVPAELVVVAVSGHDADDVSCNLPQAARKSAAEARFISTGEALPAGYEIQVQLGALPVPWTAYAPWLAGASLVVLIAGTVIRERRKAEG